MPKGKRFDGGAYGGLVRQLTSDMPTKDFEAACAPIVFDILKQCEGFTMVEQGPSFTGTPFDYFGFRDGAPYVVELKASRHHFNLPHETQRHRLQQLLETVEGLHVALLQIKVCDGVYRILYDADVVRLFSGRKAPMDPVVDWVRSAVRAGQVGASRVAGSAIEEAQRHG